MTSYAAIPMEVTAVHVLQATTSVLMVELVKVHIKTLRFVDLVKQKLVLTVCMSACLFNLESWLRKYYLYM